jgi:hypothetical protein
MSRKINKRMMIAAPGQHERLIEADVADPTTVPDCNEQ